MCKQILQTSIIRNIWRTVRGTCMLILGLKEFNESNGVLLYTDTVHYDAKGASDFTNMD